MFSNRSGSKGNRHFRRRSTRHRRRTHKRKGGMMSSHHKPLSMKPLSTTLLSPDSEYTNVFVSGPYGEGEHKRFGTTTFVILKESNVAKLKNEIVELINTRIKRKGGKHEYVMPSDANIRDDRAKILSDDMLMQDFAYKNLYIQGWEDRQLT